MPQRLQRCSPYAEPQHACRLVAAGHWSGVGSRRARSATSLTGTRDVPRRAESWGVFGQLFACVGNVDRTSGAGRSWVEDGQIVEAQKTYVASQNQIIDHTHDAAHGRRAGGITNQGRIGEVYGLTILQQSPRQQLIIDVQRGCPQVLVFGHCGIVELRITNT